MTASSVEVKIVLVAPDGLPIPIFEVLVYGRGNGWGGDRTEVIGSVRELRAFLKGFQIGAMVTGKTHVSVPAIDENHVHSLLREAPIQLWPESPASNLSSLRAS